MSSPGSTVKTSVLVLGGLLVIGIALVIGFVLGASRPGASAIEVTQAPRGEGEAVAAGAVHAEGAAPTQGPGTRSLPSVPVDPAQLNGEPPKALTAVAERDLQVAELVKSGPDTTNQLPRLKGVNEEWTALAKELGQNVKIEPWRCYRAGCYATIAEIEPAKVEALGARLIESRGFLAWPGGKFRSGPIATEGKDSHGRVQVTWAFFSDESEGKPPGAAPDVN